MTLQSQRPEVHVEKPSFVIDCSVVMAWCFADESSAASHALLDRMADETAAVPSWLFLEVCNVLALAENKGRITPAQSGEFMALLETLSWQLDQAVASRAFTHLLPLCRAHGLTSYDAVYLDLAMRLHLPLATNDATLRNAAQKVRVKLLI